MIQVYSALGTAIATYTGQNYGVGEMKRIKKGVNACLVIETIYSIFCYGVILVGIPKGSSYSVCGYLY